MWKYDEKFKNAKVIDGSTPLTYIFEYGNGANLEIALTKYNESLLRAYYSENMDEAKRIMDEAGKQIEQAGLDGYIDMIEQKEKDGLNIRF